MSLKLRATNDTYNVFRPTFDEQHCVCAWRLWFHVLAWRDAGLIEKCKSSSVVATRMTPLPTFVALFYLPRVETL